MGMNSSKYLWSVMFGRISIQKWKHSNIQCCVSLFRERSFPTIEVSGMSISQSIDAPLTTQDTVTMSGSLSSHNGNGSGMLYDEKKVSCHSMNKKVLGRTVRYKV